MSWYSGFGHGFVAGAVCIVIRWAAVQFVLRVRRPLVQQMPILLGLWEVNCNSLGGKVLVRVLMRGLAARSSFVLWLL